MEVGTEPDFLLIMKNNLQDPNLANPSKMAGKYMAFGKGNLSDLFFSVGIKCTNLQIISTMTNRALKQWNRKLKLKFRKAPMIK